MLATAARVRTDSASDTQCTGARTRATHLSLRRNEELLAALVLKDQIFARPQDLHLLVDVDGALSEGMAPHGCWM